MRTTPLRTSLAALLAVLCLAPSTVNAQYLAAPARSAARAGLSATTVEYDVAPDRLAAQVNRWQGAERATAETDGGQWVKGGLIGAAILGVGGYAFLNGMNGLSDNSWSQSEIIRGSAVLAGLGFVIGSLIGSGFEK